MKKLLFILALICSTVSAQSIPVTGSLTMGVILATKKTVDSLQLVNGKRVNALEASYLKLKKSFDSLRKAMTPPLLTKKYSDIQASPFSTGTAIVPGDATCCGPGIINFASGRPPGDYKLNGAFTAGFSIRQADGAYRFVNTAGDVYGTEGAGQAHGVSTTNAAAYNLSLYGLDATHPMVVTGENGFQMPSASGGSTILVQNAVARNPHASGFTANFAVSGTNFYGSVTLVNFRSFNAGEEGVCYIGNTTGTTTTPNYINTATVTNCFSYRSSREGTQYEHINLLTSSYNTCVLPGSNWNGNGGAGQQNCVQAHDLGPGSTITYSVYSGGVDLWNIFTHGTSISHNFFSFSAKTGTAPQTYNGFIGRTDNQIWYAASPRMTGDSLIFDGDYFKYTGAGTLDYLTIVEERIAHIIFRNCTFSSNITHIMKDNRAGGSSNTLTGDIGDHGNVSATVVEPTFGGSYNDPDNYTVHGLQPSTSSRYDWGFRGLTHYP